jgi:hypothetical protein
MQHVLMPPHLHMMKQAMHPKLHQTYDANQHKVGLLYILFK